MHASLAAQRVAVALDLRIPAGDVHGDLSRLMYPIRRLVTSGQDIPVNMELLFGPSWEEHVKKV